VLVSVFFQILHLLLKFLGTPVGMSQVFQTSLQVGGALLLLLQDKPVLLHICLMAGFQFLEALCHDRGASCCLLHFLVDAFKLDETLLHQLRLLLHFAKFLQASAEFHRSLVDTIKLADADFHFLGLLFALLGFLLIHFQFSHTFL